MAKYEYEIYYHYDGPSVSDPFAKEKTEHEMEDAFLNFQSEISVYLDANLSNISSRDVIDDKTKRIFTIETTANDEEVHNALDRCLQDLDLRANLLTKS